MASIVHENSKATISKKKATIEIAIFSVIDTACLFLYAWGMGVPWYMIIIFSVAVAVLLNYISYHSSSDGLGYLKSIPDINYPQILTDKNNTRRKTVLLILVVIGAQSFLGIYRYNQINVKIGEFKKNEMAYESSLKDTVFESTGDKRKFTKENKPKYDGVELFDWISFIVPIITTIASFSLGLSNAKKYTRFENEEKEKWEKLQEQRHKLLDLKNEVEPLISELELASGIPNLREVILNGINEEDGDPNAIGNFRNKLRQNFVDGAPKYYEGHIHRLFDELELVGGQIRNDISRIASNPTIFATMTLENKFSDKLRKLKEPDTHEIFKKGKGV